MNIFNLKTDEGKMKNLLKAKKDYDDARSEFKKAKTEFKQIEEEVIKIEKELEFKEKSGAAKEEITSIQKKARTVKNRMEIKNQIVNQRKEATNIKIADLATQEISINKGKIELLRDDPLGQLTTLFSLGYFFITLIGMTTDIRYYRSLGIDILSYAEVSYFFLAGLRHSETLWFFPALIAVFVIMMVVSTIGAYPFIRFVSLLLRRPFSIFLIVIIVTFGITLIGPVKKADRVKSMKTGDSTVVTSMPLKYRENVIYIGHTGKFAFFRVPHTDFNVNKGIIHIPVENIICFNKDSRQDQLTQSIGLCEPAKNTDAIRLAECLDHLDENLATIGQKFGDKLEELVKGINTISTPSANRKYSGCPVNLWKSLEKKIKKDLIDVSKPLIFSLNSRKWEPTATDRVYVRSFLNQHGDGGSNLLIIGMASPDGSKKYNEDLAMDRANFMKKWLKSYNTGFDAEPKTETIGEEHCTNGIRDSRCVRLAIFKSEEPRAIHIKP